MERFGPKDNQRPGYPGHPEFELAVLRLYRVTKDPRHWAFAEHMLAARGSSSRTLNGQRFFMWEAEKREDSVYGCWMKTMDDLESVFTTLCVFAETDFVKDTIRHTNPYMSRKRSSVIPLGLCICSPPVQISVARFLEDAKSLWADAMEKRMYITGGFESEPQVSVNLAALSLIIDS